MKPHALALLIICAPAALAAGELEDVRTIAPLLAEVIKSEVAIEVRQWDDTRVDLLTPEYAIEADYPAKWAESIGQSLYYAEITSRKPGILLIVKDRRTEGRFIYRCQTVCAREGIKLWVWELPK